MNDKHDDEDFDARFEREIDFSHAEPYPRAKPARLLRAPELSDRHPVPHDGVEAAVVKRKRVRHRANPQG